MASTCWTVADAREFMARSRLGVERAPFKLLGGQDLKLVDRYEPGGRRSRHAGEPTSRGPVRHGSRADAEQGGGAAGGDQLGAAAVRVGHGPSLRRRRLAEHPRDRGRSARE
jgi:hypothetical protein